MILNVDEYGTKYRTLQINIVDLFLFSTEFTLFVNFYIIVCLYIEIVLAYNLYVLGQGRNQLGGPGGRAPPQ